MICFCAPCMTMDIDDDKPKSDTSGSTVTSNDEFVDNVNVTQLPPVAEVVDR